MKKVLRVTTSFSLAALLTFSSLMSPVVAAYGLNEAKPAEAVTDVASAGDDGATSRGDDAESSEATVDQSPVEGDIEAIDSLSQGAAESDAKTEQQVDSVESDFQYVYLAYPSLPSGSNQVIAFATPNDGEVLSSATLGYVSANGVKGSVDASATADNSAAFTFGAKLEANTYFLTSISYYLEGDGTEHKIDLSDRDYSFTVADSSMNSEGTSVYYADGDGNAVEAQSIQQALECADSPDGVSTYAARSARNVSVIALDAGHGGSDPGAQGNGKSEADLTWKIVTACKNKLEAYGFKVVLAREQYGNYSGNDFLYRVQRCIDQGAQAFVSFHINSGPSAAHGAEVYAPTANGSDYTQVSVELANKVMNNLAAMGLTYRGVFQMQVGDEFAVIRCAREQGIPGILIEHGFISNAGDVWNYFSDEGCKQLGEADADAIISQFPKSTWFNGSLEYKKSGKKIDMTLKCSGGEPTNAAFKVESPSGRIDWVQAYDQKDHSWSASFDFDREYGVFKVSAYVTVSNETFEADSKTFGDNKCSLSFDLTETQVTVDAGQWAIEPNVVSYQILSEGGKSQWIPAKRSGDSWICPIPLNDLQDVFGKKTVKAWCILDGAEAFPCGEGSFSVARPDVKLSCSASSGSLSVSATGFSSQPSNAAVQVAAPSGACRWYQAARGSDGSWAAEVPAAADFGEFGSYSVSLWATYGSSTERWAKASADVARPDVKLSCSASSGSLSVSATGFSSQPSNAAVQVAAPSGACRWYQAARGSDGSWAAEVPAAADFGEFGSYSVSLWATYGSSTERWAKASADVARPDVKLSCSASSGSLSVSATGFSSQPSNAAVQVAAPSGACRWYQAARGSDGSWAAEVPAAADFGEFGSYSVSLWATYGSSTERWAKASADVARPDVKLSCSASSGSLSVSATGFSSQPSNAAVQVAAPSGACRWYQAARGSDGSWAAEVPAAADFGEFGSYSVSLWATYGSSTERWAKASADVARPDVKLSCSASSGSLSVSATGFSSQPSNAAVQVAAPSGACRWYQAARGSDGSWAAEVPAAADFGDAGIYSIKLWGTFDTFTCSLKSQQLYFDGSRFPIGSSSNSNPAKMAVLFKEMSDFPSSIYSKYGASDIEQFCKLIYEEALAEGINPDVVFAQSMVETGWLKFGGQVSPEQCNFAGIGALDSGVCGASFNGYGSESVRMGIRAQVQHLKAYSGTGELVNQCIDPRFHLVKRGTAPFVENLSGTWASDVSYGVKIRRILTRLYQLN